MKPIRWILAALILLGAVGVLSRHPPAGGWHGAFVSATRWLRMTVNPDSANAPASSVDEDASASAAAPSDDEADHRDNGLSADEEEGAPSRFVRAGGLPAIRLTNAEQRQTGVRVQTLASAEYRQERTAVGRVIDVQPLLVLRNAYNAARADLALAQAALASSGPAVVRLRKLHGEDANVSTRQLQAAQAEAAADRAKVAAAQRRLQDIHDEGLQRWGTTLTQWALGDSPDELESLVSHRDCLVMISLDPGQALPPDTRTIYVGPTGERGQARKADFVSDAPQTDTVTQGQTFYFKAGADKLRTGMRIQAWIPQGATLNGVEVPDSAVIWYAGRLWVYVQDDDGLFVRRELATHHETHEGWFATAGVRAGDKVVVSGAQMLFSEEFRTAIPSEDDR
jgi:hypothetical protein